MTRLVRELMPADGEVAGLLALMLLTEARSAARVSDGELVPLASRTAARGTATRSPRATPSSARGSPPGEAPGRFQILAAISAVHTDARDVRDTDWSQIVALYDQLVRLDPSPIVLLNRAIAIAELDGPGSRWRRWTVCR